MSFVIILSAAVRWAFLEVAFKIAYWSNSSLSSIAAHQKHFTIPQVLFPSSSITSLQLIFSYALCYFMHSEVGHQLDENT